MIVHIDTSAAEQSCRICETLGKGGNPSFSAWRDLYNSEGMKTLMESGFKKKREIKRYLLAHGKPEGDSNLPSDKKIGMLGKRLEGYASSAVSGVEEWFPLLADSKDITVCLTVYDGESDDSEAPVIDAVYAISLEPPECEKLIRKLILTCLLKRHQNLERYYLKNFLPIRRHMEFIYALWEIQINGLISLMEDQSGQPGDSWDFSEMGELLSAASRADRTELAELGKRFREEVDTEKTGRALYRLWEGDKAGIGESLGRPTLPYILLRREGKEMFTPEGAFFLDQLDSLLS